MVFKVKLATLLSLALSLSSLNAWKYQGHYLVARMAYDILQKENPTALERAEEVLQIMANETLTDAERDHRFVECAAFADVIKYRGGGWQSNWHFVDIPYFDQGGNNEDFPEFKEDMKNITVAIPGIVDWLMDKPGYQDSYPYQTIMKYNQQNDTHARSYALRLLIHYHGDIHQPLHGLSRVNPDFPAGDRGGNDFPLPSHYSVKELHAAWDSVLYEFHVNDKLPYDEAGWTKLGASAEKLVSNNNVDPSLYKFYDVNTWAHETWQVGTDNAYEGATIGQALPSDYVSKNNKIAERQLVIAPIRLANTIEMIYNPKQTNAETFLGSKFFLQ